MSHLYSKDQTLDLFLHQIFCFQAGAKISSDCHITNSTHVLDVVLGIKQKHLQSVEKGSLPGSLPYNIKPSLCTV